MLIITTQDTSLYCPELFTNNHKLHKQSTKYISENKKKTFDNKKYNKLTQKKEQIKIRNVYKPKWFEI